MAIISRPDRQDAPSPSAGAASADSSANASTPRDILRFQCGTLHEHWYVAALSREVTAKKPFASTILEEPVVLFRDRNGHAAALVDRCLHRNAALSAGDVFDGCIGCPYHGWTYDASGECITVPSEGPGKPPRVARRLARFPTVEQDGLVWVYVGDPDQATKREPFALPHNGEKGWRSYMMLTEFEGDVTDLVENFMDVPHTAFVHSGWFRRATQAKPAEATVQRTQDSVLVEYFQPDDSIGFSKWLLNPDGQPMTHTDRFYMPNVTRVDYMWGARRGFVITSQITPVTRDRARVYTAIAFRFGVFNALARWLLPAYTRAVINQDVRIMRVQTRNLARFGERQFHGTEADAIHRAIESLREHARTGESTTAPEPFATRISFWM